MAVPPAAVSIKLIYPAANPSLLWRWKAFLIFWFGGFIRQIWKLKNAFQRQRRLGLLDCLADMKLTRTIALQSTYHCRVNKCYLHGYRVNCPLSTRLPGEQVLIYPAAVYNKPYSPGRRVSSLSLYRDSSYDARLPWWLNADCKTVIESH